MPARECVECGDRGENSDQGLCLLHADIDGGPVRCVGPWAKAKLYYVSRYAEMFSTAMKDKWPKRAYVDLFAGPGRCIVRGSGEFIDGSPLLALAAQHPFTHYLFVDANSACTSALTTRTSGLQGVTVDVLAGDCNTVFQSGLLKLPTGALSMAFIDPTSTQIHFATINALKKLGRVDLIINFAQWIAINRLVPLNLDAVSQSQFDLFFGDGGWRQVAEQASERGMKVGYALRDYYKERLRLIGYRSVSANDALISDSTGRPLYALLFASQHPRGCELWDKAMQILASGQRQLPLGL